MPEQSSEVRAKASATISRLEAAKALLCPSTDAQLIRQHDDQILLAKASIVQSKPLDAQIKDLADFIGRKQSKRSAMAKEIITLGESLKALDSDLSFNALKLDELKARRAELDSQAAEPPSPPSPAPDNAQLNVMREMLIKLATSVSSVPTVVLPPEVKDFMASPMVTASLTQQTVPPQAAPAESSTSPSLIEEPPAKSARLDHSVHVQVPAAPTPTASHQDRDDRSRSPLTRFTGPAFDDVDGEDAHEMSQIQAALDAANQALPSLDNNMGQLPLGSTNLSSNPG